MLSEKPDKTPNIELDLQYLVLRLSLLDLRLQAAVRRWRLAGQDPGDDFRGLYVADVEVDMLLEHPFGVNWGDAIVLNSAEQASLAQRQTHLDRQLTDLAAQARSRGSPLRLDSLSVAFDLDDFEIQALLICLAPCLDLRYERLYGYLQDDVTRRRPSVSLILNLLCDPGLTRLASLERFSPQASLLRFRLLEPLNEPSAPASLLGQAFVINETVLAWLLGTYQAHPDLGLHARLLSPAGQPSDGLFAGKSLDQLPKEEDALLAFYGPELSGQAAAARLYASRLGRPLLSIDLAVLPAASAEDASVLSTQLAPAIAASAVRLALRDARLTGAVLYLPGWERCLEDDAPPPDMLAEICSHPGPVILGSLRPWMPRRLERRRRLVPLEFPLPSYQQRLAHWRYAIARLPRALRASRAFDLNTLSAAFALSGSQIGEVVASAADRASQAGASLSMADLFAAARTLSSPRLSLLSRKIEPRYAWDDIVLPADPLSLLHEIAATVRSRSQVLDDWGAGRKLASSRGVAALFAGPPGAGKTMAAEVIAGELGLELYKIDLSMVVSKYVGETEKNLERIFSEAEAGSAILFFDEADSLFGKRSEVRDSHDRYANIETSYLLQRMEAYDGVTILATNLRTNLDEAFTRRLAFVVDFPFPEEEDRLRIWQALFPPGVPRDLALDFANLARRFKLSGGGIRNAILSAAYQAAADGGVVTMQHLLHGTRRELQKMGRIIPEAESTVER